MLVPHGPSVSDLQPGHIQCRSQLQYSVCRCTVNGWFLRACTFHDWINWINKLSLKDDTISYLFYFVYMWRTLTPFQLQIVCCGPYFPPRTACLCGIMEDPETHMCVEMKCFLVATTYRKQHRSQNVQIKWHRNKDKKKTNLRVFYRWLPGCSLTHEEMHSG